MNTRRMVLLTEGYSEPIAAKTASCLLRYCTDQVVAMFDSTQVGKTAQDLLGVGGAIPVIGKLEEAPTANELVIGIAPPGGRAPAAWKPVLLAAIERGMKITSGLHDFLGDDPELAAAAAKRGVQIVDVRKNDERDVATRQGLHDKCLRLLTIGQDCSVGKMVAALELANALKKHGVDAKFVATGQTGIMIEGDGCPIDRVISDFVNGAVEKQVLANQHRQVLVVEGQATISHPRYSAVSAGLLHGCVPHGMVLVYEAGRTHYSGMPHMPLPPLKRVIQAYEDLALFGQPAKVIAVAINSRRLNEAEADAERNRVRDELGLPAADPIRHGSDELVAAIEKLRKQVCG